ncbi:transcription antitermination factor NusB [Deinococcus yavapaiensis]|uniref:Transcription antitermination protein NusB n=1 Tax=Deinococcus yavapaiensis KR-236 TaxID=694435 RepID=A0A318SKR6_9DEIO|nr:transcription antitermination factor NusB [Deinococcus yavapaiensis]PYE54959.1 NusB antitermination factor [Deinococcus yavapaiensis KR-236]
MRRRDTGPASGRRAAREFAFQVIFESAQGGLPLAEALTRAEGAMRTGGDLHAALDADTLTFARELVETFEARRHDVDEVLHRTIHGWSFGQLAQTDLNILRLATSELLDVEQPPVPIIESAVRIARKFGGDESGRFVNGVLASVLRTLGRDAGEKPRDA